MSRQLRCCVPGCEAKGPKVGWLDWLLTGLLLLDWNFWLCEEHRWTEAEWDDLECELRLLGKLV